MSCRWRSVSPTSSRPSSSRHRVYGSIWKGTTTLSPPGEQRTCSASRSTVTGSAGSASTALHRASTSACGRITVSRPALVELLRKMSANRELITTRKPPSSSAQLACSREEPVPKSGPATRTEAAWYRSEEHTSELQSRQYLVCRLLLEKKKHKRKLHPTRLTKLCYSLTHSRR